MRVSRGGEAKERARRSALAVAVIRGRANSEWCPGRVSVAGGRSPHREQSSDRGGQRLPALGPPSYERAGISVPDQRLCFRWQLTFGIVADMFQSP